MRKEELLACIGDISQIGGVKDYNFNDGKRKGARAIEINTENFSRPFKLSWICRKQLKPNTRFFHLDISK